MFLMDMAYNGGRTLREFLTALGSDEYIQWLAYSRIKHEQSKKR